MRNCILFICFALLALGSCKPTSLQPERLSDEEMAAFNARAKEISNDYVFNNTYDYDNVVVADSLYDESVKVGSDEGKMYALRIKYYALVSYPEEGENFLKAVDEYIDLAKKLGETGKYYDAMNAKMYYYIGDEKLMAAQMMVREVMEEAEKSEDREGLYFANYMMSTIYQCRSNFNMSIPFLLKAEEYADGDSTLVCLINRDLSIAYGNVQNWEEGVMRAIKSYDIAPTLVHQAWSEHQFLCSLFDSGKYRDFLSSYENSDLVTKAYDTVLPESMKEDIRMRYALCKHDYQKALDIVENSTYEEYKANNMLAIYKFKGDYKKAFETKLELDKQEDSTQFQILSEDLSEMEAQLGNSQLRLQAEKLRTRNVRNIYTSIIIFLVILFGIGIFMFVTLKKKNEELDKALETAMRASNVKSIFINNMSHEFHTPLNHISGFAQVLADESMPLDEESTREMSRAIVESSQHLTKVLDNIVSVADHLSSMTELEQAESVLKSLSD